LCSRPKKRKARPAGLAFFCFISVVDFGVVFIFFDVVLLCESGFLQGYLRKVDATGWFFGGEIVVFYVVNVVF